MFTVKRFQSALLAGVLGLSVLTACATPTVSGGEPGQTKNTIAVSGNGVVYGRPDLATVQIGVQSRNLDAGQAIAENNLRAEAILSALKALGIEEKDLQTANFSVYAQQDYDPQTGQAKDTITYVVDNTLTVTVRDLTKLGQALGAATEAGANNVHGISFGVADPAALEAEARAKAMADARSRAEQLAKAAGVTLGSPVTISEAFGGPAPIIYAEARLDAAQAASVPVATGQLQVNLQVSVVYEIR